MTENNSSLIAHFKEECLEFSKKHGTPVRFEALLPDINSIYRGKWLPASGLDKLLEGSARLPLSTYTPTIYGEEVAENNIGEAIGDPDGVLSPVPGTLVPMPWTEVPTAQIQVEIYDSHGQISPYSPRNLLHKVLTRFAAQGLRPVVATELEFYLFEKREHSLSAPRPLDRSPRAQNYDMELLGRLEPILNAILEACTIQDIPTDSLIAEFGPGQFEINFPHSENVLRIADQSLMFRRLVRAVAQRHGLEASFMAKPYAHQPGNGMHAHISVLNKQGHNIFDNQQGNSPISPTLKAAIKGCLEHMQDSQAIFAPHFNSYRRFTNTGFAPVSASWGCNHRSAGIRLPATQGPAARLEHRIAGADANPYLALAAILAAILEGINKADSSLPAAIDSESFIKPSPLTQHWQEAIRCFKHSDFIEKTYSAEFRRVYTGIKQSEQKLIGTQITPQELEHYLTRI